MARITVTSGDHGFDQANFFSHPDFVGLQLVSRSDSLLSFTGLNGIFLRFRGNFSGLNQDNWQIDQIEIGRFDSTELVASDLRLPFNDFIDASTEAQLINAALSGDDEIISDNNGNLTWSAGAGDDFLDLGTGDDVVFAGTGSDTLSINDEMFNAQVIAGREIFDLTTADGNDFLFDVELLSFNDGLAALYSSSRGNRCHRRRPERPDQQ